MVSEAFWQSTCSPITSQILCGSEHSIKSSKHWEVGTTLGGSLISRVRLRSEKIDLSLLKDLFKQICIHGPKKNKIFNTNNKKKNILKVKKKKKKKPLWIIATCCSCLGLSPVLSLEMFLDKTVSVSRLLCACCTGIRRIPQWTGSLQRNRHRETERWQMFT